VSGLTIVALHCSQLACGQWAGRTPHTWICSSRLSLRSSPLPFASFLTAFFWSCVRCFLCRRLSFSSGTSKKDGGSSGTAGKGRQGEEGGVLLACLGLKAKSSCYQWRWN
jgi:hypothetical protein